MQKVLSGGQAEKVEAAAAPRYFRSATFFGFRSFSGGVGVENAGAVRLGVSVQALPVALEPGDELTWTPPGGTQETLNNIWMKGAAGDGVYVMYYE